VAAARYVPGTDLPGSDWVWVILGVLVMLAGFTLRVGSIVVLGRFFRRDVTVEVAQRVVRRGPYGYVRHPAYAGNLLVALGFGLALANWLSIAARVVLPYLALLPRIRVEEAALENALGEPYRAYEADTARLVPGLS
jgi:protein-S-isoprenylcysteine O-methyltransferase